MTEVLPTPNLENTSETSRPSASSGNPKNARRKNARRNRAGDESTDAKSSPVENVHASSPVSHDNSTSPVNENVTKDKETVAESGEKGANTQNPDGDNSNSTNSKDASRKKRPAKKRGGEKSTTPEATAEASDSQEKPADASVQKEKAEKSSPLDGPKTVPESISPIITVPVVSTAQSKGEKPAKKTRKGKAARPSDAAEPNAVASAADSKESSASNASGSPNISITIPVDGAPSSRKVVIVNSDEDATSNEGARSGDVPEKADTKERAPRKRGKKGKKADEAETEVESGGKEEAAVAPEPVPEPVKETEATPVEKSSRRNAKKGKKAEDSEANIEPAPQPVKESEPDVAEKEPRRKNKRGKKADEAEPVAPKDVEPQKEAEPAPADKTARKARKGKKADEADVPEPKEAEPQKEAEPAPADKTARKTRKGKKADEADVPEPKAKTKAPAAQPVVASTPETASREPRAARAKAAAPASAPSSAPPAGRTSDRNRAPRPAFGGQNRVIITDGVVREGGVPTRAVLIPQILFQWVGTNDANSTIDTLLNTYNVQDIAVVHANGEVYFKVFGSSMMDTNRCASALKLALQQKAEIAEIDSRVATLRNEMERVERETKAGLRSEFEVHPDVVKFIIGAKGANVKRVSEDYGVDITVATDIEPPLVYIRGKDAKNVAQARRQIEWKRKVYSFSAEEFRSVTAGGFIGELTHISGVIANVEKDSTVGRFDLCLIGLGDSITQAEQVVDSRLEHIESLSQARTNWIRSYEKLQSTRPRPFNRGSAKNRD